MLFHHFTENLGTEHRTGKTDCNILIPYIHREIGKSHGAEILGASLHLRIIGRIIDQHVNMPVLFHKHISYFAEFFTGSDVSNYALASGIITILFL